MSADEGIGIERAALEQVFEPFVRLERASGVPGVGLGLPIARAIVEAHGGQIAVESRGRGRGATFTVTLPLCTSPADART
ncbi:MAG: sensor histidine kinase [Dehalococcoidia bacterium]